MSDLRWWLCSSDNENPMTPTQHELKIYSRQTPTQAPFIDTMREISPHHKDWAFVGLDPSPNKALAESICWAVHNMAVSSSALYNFRILSNPNLTHSITAAFTCIVALALVFPLSQMGKSSYWKWQTFWVAYFLRCNTKSGSTCSSRAVCCVSCNFVSLAGKETLTASTGGKASSLLPPIDVRRCKVS